MSIPLLITIPFSHYCEKARWALAHAGVAFVEAGHLPLFHMVPARRAGGRTSVPVLVTDEGVLPDSTDIVQYANRQAPPGRGLYGDSDEERRAIADLEDLFDEKLGPHTRRWAYFHLLPRRERTIDLARQGVPRWEQAVLPFVLPAARAILRRALNITPESAQRSQDRVDAMFDRVAGLLANGRTFLVGERLSAADLTFASLTGPAVMPARYGVELPPIEALPGIAAERVRAWREHPAGKFALRVYERHR
jgi:glutathione S-transferase